MGVLVGGGNRGFGGCRGGSLGEGGRRCKGNGGGNGGLDRYVGGRGFEDDGVVEARWTSEA